MGAISFRRTNLLGTLNEMVGYKSGISLNTEQLANIAKDHLRVTISALSPIALIDPISTAKSANQQHPSCKPAIMMSPKRTNAPINDFRPITALRPGKLYWP